MAKAPLKSYVDDILELYRALFQDAQYAYPNLGSAFSKDYDRLRFLVMQRGIRFLTVDLPALAKHLERCLASGQYVASGLPGSRQISRRVPIPEFLGGLYLLVFNKNGILKEDVDVTALFFLRQLLVASKRASLQCSEEYVLAEICEFLKTDDALPIPDPWWVTDRISSTLPFKGFALEERYVRRMFGLSKPDVQEAGESLTPADGCLLLGMLDKVVNILSSTLGPYRFEEWNFRNGPGAVSDRPKTENRTDFRNWSLRLESMFPWADCAFHSYDSWIAAIPRSDSVARGSLNYIDGSEPSSKLIDVPKTYVKPRLIAAEPSEHMWCQQNVKQYMYQRVEDTWISRFVNFTDQSRNQDLALEGSRDGSLSTVDLSAASDRVSCVCVGNTFRGNPELLLALRASRTRRCQIKHNDAILDIEVRKYSTMGNATTFPVETLIFLACAITSALQARGDREVTPELIRSLEGKVSVFGDDIVVPTNAIGALKVLLEVLDFKVNVSKTFSSGKFRESCGVDAFAGQNITPAYYKAPCEQTPDSIVSRLEVSNNFYQRLLVNASNWLASTIPHWVKPVSVHMGSGVFGLTSFVHPGVPSSHKLRWNQDLQREEILMNIPVGISTKSPIEDDTALLLYFNVRSEPMTCTTGLGRCWISGEASRASIGVTSGTTLKFKRRWVDVAAIAAPETRMGSSASTATENFRSDAL